MYFSFFMWNDNKMSFEILFFKIFCSLFDVSLHRELSKQANKKQVDKVKAEEQLFNVKLLYVGLIPTEVVKKNFLLIFFKSM